MDKNEQVTKEELNDALKSVYKRTLYEASNLVDEKLKDVRSRISDNADDVNDLKQRMNNVERQVYPLSEAVEFIKEDVKEIKTDIKEGFKELKLDFKEQNKLQKEEIDRIAKRIDGHDKSISEFGGKMTLKDWVKSSEGIFVSLIGGIITIIITLIQLFAK